MLSRLKGVGGMVQLASEGQGEEEGCAGFRVEGVRHGSRLRAGARRRVHPGRGAGVHGTAPERWHGEEGCNTVGQRRHAAYPNPALEGTSALRSGGGEVVSMEASFPAFSIEVERHGMRGGVEEGGRWREGEGEG